MHSTCCEINRKFKITGCKKRLHDFTSDLLRTMHPRPRHQPRPSTLSSFKSSYSHKQFYIRASRQSINNGLSRMHRIKDSKHSAKCG